MGKTIPMRLNVPPHVFEWLEQRVKDGSFQCPATAARSILESVVEEDLQQHGEEHRNVLAFMRREAPP